MNVYTGGLPECRSTVDYLTSL